MKKRLSDEEMADIFQDEINDAKDDIFKALAGIGKALTVNYSSLDRDIDEAEARLVALGWIRQDLQDMKPELLSKQDYLQELRRMLRLTKSGELIPPKPKELS